MKHLLLTGTLILFVLNCGWAQKNKKEQDIKAIKAMSGCFNVAFNFAETFNYSKDSLYKPSKEYHSKALEWVSLITDKANKIQLQHLLIVTDKKGKPHIIKHWRQDWIFENKDLYVFDKNNHWKYTQLPKYKVKGQWTQKVYQVDDSPRYEGSATWVHVDGRSFWENKTDAPLARREYTNRKDYNVMVRNNHVEIIKKGWIHDQDNYKIIRKNNQKDFLLAQEKGYNTYTKVSDDKCKAAIQWWKKNKGFWKKVRKKWDKTFSLKKDIFLQRKVNKKPLYEYLFELNKKSNSRKKINKFIDSFLTF